LEFRKLLEVVTLDGRKENSLRRKYIYIYILHSFRRFVKSVVSDAVNQDSTANGSFGSSEERPYYVSKKRAGAGGDI
jgi:hypothetical protein